MYGDKSHGAARAATLNILPLIQDIVVVRTRP